MKTISADFNSDTETGGIRLNSAGIKENMKKQGVNVGDIAWLSDGEIKVQAHIAIDDKYGIVGLPRWETRIDIEDVEDIDDKKD